MKGARGIDRLMRPEGGFAMVALDQRESMRDLRGSFTTDDDLRGFKAGAAEILSPFASAVLLDSVYGVDGERPAVIADDCAFILAVDRFVQAPGSPVSDSVLDEAASAESIAAAGADAIKLLALWTRGEDPGRRAGIVHSVVELGRRSGVPVILEVIVRDADGPWRDGPGRDAAIVEAAAEFAGFGADLYKAEVPDHGIDAARVTAVSREISAVLSCPWVVLSNGVEPARFGDAVAAACAGGASGFLAGRAIWSQAAALRDFRESLRTVSVPTLERLSSMVPAGQPA
jgi:sulfofructosephosphate aldolase